MGLRRRSCRTHITIVETHSWNLPLRETEQVFESLGHKLFYFPFETDLCAILQYTNPNLASDTRNVFLSLCFVLTTSFFSIQPENERSERE